MYVHCPIQLEITNKRDDFEAVERVETMVLSPRPSHENRGFPSKTRSKTILVTNIAHEKTRKKHSGNQVSERRPFILQFLEKTIDRDPKEVNERRWKECH